MPPPRAELADSREILPGEWLHTYHAPGIATAAQPGQYVHIRTPDYPAPVMRHPFAINTYDRSRGMVSILFRVADGATSWLARTRPGEGVEMYGPLGRTFRLEPKTRHVLLIAAGSGIAGVRALADDALASDRQVTLVASAASTADVYPSSLLPDKIEYVVATDDGSFGHRGPITDLVSQFEAWADQAFASGPIDVLARGANLARGRQARLGVAALGARRGRTQGRRRAWLQVVIQQNVGCAIGTCLGCVIMGADGPQRVCREGPVFASDEIAWEARWP